MAPITEIFGMSMKGPERVDAIRETARADFTSLKGVSSWKTFVTTGSSRRTLYAEIFTFPDHATAKATTPQFAERDAPKPS